MTLTFGAPTFSTLGRVWNDFVHDTDELVMLVEGEEEFLIPSGTSHTARNVGKSTSKWLYGYKRR